MQRPIADVFTWPSDTPQLIGGRCGACAAVCFPTQSRCPRCGTAGLTDELLPTSGRLVSFTTQAFPPIAGFAGDETGRNFTPFGVGLVQLGEVVRVEARLTEADPSKLDFDMPVELSIVPFYVDADGVEIMTFAFTPAGDVAAAS